MLRARSVQAGAGHRHRDQEDRRLRESRHRRADRCSGESGVKIFPMRIKNMVMLEHFYKGVRHAELRLPCCDEPHPEPELPGGASQVCNLIKHYFSTTYRVLVYGVLPVYCFKCCYFQDSGEAVSRAADPRLCSDVPVSDLSGPAPRCGRCSRKVWHNMDCHLLWSYIILMCPKIS